MGSKKASKAMNANNNGKSEKIRTYRIISEELKMRGADTTRLERLIRRYIRFIKITFNKDPDEEEIPQHAGTYMSKSNKINRMLLLENSIEYEIRRLKNINKREI